MRRAAPVSAPKTESFRREPGATGQNSCQPEGLQPESAMAALLVLAIERLLPSPGALPSPILAATHTCFMVLGTLSRMGVLSAAPRRFKIRTASPPCQVLSSSRNAAHD